MKSDALRAESLADLVELVPFLLGFHPRESIVLLWLRRRRLVLTARLDAVAGTAGPGTAAAIARMRRRSEADGVVIIGYSDGDIVAGLTGIRDLAAREAQVVDVIHADGMRCRSLTRDGEGCCPERGTPYSTGSGRMAAEAVFAGLVAFPDRADVVALVAPDQATSIDEDALVMSIAGFAGMSARCRSEAVRRLLGRLLEHDGPLTASDCADLAVLVSDVAVRDAAVTLLRLDNAFRLIDIWSQVCRLVPGRYVGTPLDILGLAAWVAGNGVLHLACVDRAREEGVATTLTEVVEKLALAAVPPRQWAVIRHQLAEAVPGAG